MTLEYSLLHKYTLSRSRRFSILDFSL